MNELQIFKSDEFGEIRTVTIENEPWFVGKDVAEALGYSNASKALMDHVDACDKLNNETLSSLGQRGGWIINESGLYALIFGSKLESAKRFKRWVTAEVLPTIRKTGSYKPAPQGKELLALAVLEAQKTIEEKNKEIERMKPKEVFADAVAGSENSILIGDLAKLICQNGYEIGQKRLFEWLRNNGFLMKYGSSKNMPVQKYLERGIFEVKEGTVLSADSRSLSTLTTKVTGKGQQYFVNIFMKKKGEVK